MPQVNLEEIFEQYKEYAGGALKLFRLSNLMVESDLLELLKNDTFWFAIQNLSKETIKSMETGETPITFMQAKSAARVLESSIESFIKTMIRKKENANLSEEESMQLLKDGLVRAIKELEYKEWKKEQERLEGE